MDFTARSARLRKSMPMPMGWRSRGGRWRKEEVETLRHTAARLRRAVRWVCVCESALSSELPASEMVPMSEAENVDREGEGPGLEAVMVLVARDLRWLYDQKQ